MGSLVYIRLIGYTAGTLLQLFWVVVILGYRRQRNFERVFFFLCLALFFFYGGSLLALNAQIYYATPPPVLHSFAVALLYVGLCMLPPILVHLHFEYAETRGLVGSQETKRILIAAAYVPILFFALRAYSALISPFGIDPSTPGRVLGRAYGVWLASSLMIGFWWQARFENSATDRPQQWFHKQLAKFFLIMTAAVVYLHFFQGFGSSGSEVTSTALALLAILPFATMLEMVYRFNFLNIGRQKNLVYAVSVTFLALLYLALVRRAALWLEPILPPEATAAILLFVLVVFFEPLQRALGRRLQETAQREMELVKRVAQEIQEEAKQGDLPSLVEFIEKKVAKAFELSLVRLYLGDEAMAGVRTGNAKRPSVADLAWKPPYFPISRGDALLGLLRAEPHGAALSGETHAALEFLCEQLPGALDLCRLIEEKLRLERELAERDRLALVGQMAASISHNLKNPLGSIKTILQVQMENAELPEAMRRETKMVLDEIGRLSTKLNQLLQFSRPAVRAGSATGNCDARLVAEEVLGVLRHEADERGVRLGIKSVEGAAKVRANAEALNDVLSNLVVNALEATAAGGQVNVELSWRGNLGCMISVEDDGAGIPAGLQEKVLQPFFTTKSRGTGLGLAIVARRVAEFGGKLTWVSPAKDGRGTRFEVMVDAAPTRKQEKEGSE